MKTKMKIFKAFAVMVLAIMAAFSMYSISYVSAVETSNLISFYNVKGYGNNGGTYDYVEFGRYPKTEIGGFNMNSDNNEIKVISTLVNAIHMQAYSNSYTNCLASQFYPNENVTKEMNINSTNYSMTYDANSGYYTLNTAVGTLAKGTQIHTYNQVVDEMAKNEIDFDSSTKINDDISGIYNSTGTQTASSSSIIFYKVEPIKWRVLDKSGTVVTLMTDEIIDSSSWYSGGYDSSAPSSEKYISSGANEFLNDATPYFTYTIEDQGIFDQNGARPTNVYNYEDGWTDGPDSDGFYESKNKGSVYNSTYSQCRIHFTIASLSKTVTIKFISYGEASSDGTYAYDYGVFSNLNEELPAENVDVKSGEFCYYSCKENTSATEKEMSYTNVANGEYDIYIRYRKDGTTSENSDSLKFKIVSPQVSSPDQVQINAKQFLARAFTNDEQNIIEGTNISVGGETATVKAYIPIENSTIGEINGRAVTGLNNADNIRGQVTDYAAKTGTPQEKVSKKWYGQYWLMGYNVNSLNDYVTATGSTAIVSPFTTKGLRPIVRVNFEAENFDKSFLRIVDSGESYFSGKLEARTNVENPADFTGDGDNLDTLKMYNYKGDFLDTYTAYQTAEIEWEFTEDWFYVYVRNFPYGENGFLVMSYVNSQTGKHVVGPITQVITQNVTYNARVAKPTGGTTTIYYVVGDNIYSCANITKYPALYVSNDGNDSNNGFTRNTALKHLQEAIKRSEAGQEIVVLSEQSLSGTFYGRAGYDFSTYFPSSGGQAIERKVNESGHHIIISRDFDGNLFNLSRYGQEVKIVFNDITFKNYGDKTYNYSFIRATNTAPGHITGSKRFSIYFENVEACGLKVKGSGSEETKGALVYGACDLIFRKGCNISNNESSGDGGVFHTSGYVTIEHSTNAVFNFIGNKSGSNGGVFYMEGSYSSSSVNIGNNSQAQDSNSIINFEGNEAENKGGVIAYDESSSYGQINLGAYANSSIIFKGNSAQSGGAIYTTKPIETVGGTGTNCITFNQNSADCGGAIYATAAAGHIYLPSYLSYNHAVCGGAIYVADGTGSFEIKQINAGYNYTDSTSGGGGIYSASNLVLNGVTISNSNDYGSDHGDGGAVYVTKDLTLTEASSTFQGNKAKNGGAIYCAGTLTMAEYQDGCKAYFIANEATGNGGAIYCKDIVTSEYSAKIEMGEILESSKYYLNKAQLGGGLYVANLSHNTLYNIRFCGESTMTGGGGLYIEGGTYSSLELNGCGSATCIGPDAGILYLNGKNLKITTIGTSKYRTYNANGAVYKETGRSGYTSNSNGGAFSVTGGNVEILPREYAEPTFSSWSSHGNGGAIYCTGSVKLYYNNYSKITFQNNASKGNGGAIYAGGTVTIEGDPEDRCSRSEITFSQNNATLNGGAIHCNGFIVYDGNQLQVGGSAVTISFNNNNASNGGAIMSDGTNGTVLINQANYYDPVYGNEYRGTITFSANKATSGNGGAICSSGACVIKGGTKLSNDEIIFTNNEATGNGGAIYAGNDVTLNTNWDCIKFTTNKANNGGAVYCNNHNLEFNIDTKTNDENYFCVIKGNTATGSGGAFYVKDFSLIVKSTVVSAFDKVENNSAGVNGGVICATSKVTLANYSPNAVYLGTKQNFNSYANTAVKRGGIIYCGEDITQQDMTDPEKGKFIFLYGQQTSNASDGDYGGGAIFLRGTLILPDAEFKYCSTNKGNGGAIYLVDDGNEATHKTLYGKLDFNGCYCTVGNGGAIYCKDDLDISGRLTLTNCYCEKSTAASTEDGNGGAIYTPKNLTISITADADISECYAYKGGAIYCGGNLSLTSSSAHYDIYHNRSTFSGQSNGGYGGAIYCGGGVSIKRAILRENGLVSNYAKIYINDAVCSNKTIYTYKGGAIYCSGNCELEDVSLYENHAIYGGVIYCNGGNVSIKEPSENRHLIYNNHAINGALIFLESSTETHNIEILGNGLLQYSYKEDEGSGYVYYDKLEDWLPTYSGSSPNAKDVTRGNEDVASLYCQKGNITVKYAKLRADSILRSKDGDCYVENSEFISHFTLASTIYASSGIVKKGGAIYASSKVTAKNCRFDCCMATEDGGAIWCGSQWQIDNCIFNKCKAGQNGGAVYLDRWNQSQENTMNSCRFDETGAMCGGAVYAREGITFNGCYFVKCSAQPSGSVLYLYDPLAYKTTFNACTITDNVCNMNDALLSGLVCYSGGNANDFDFINCNISNNYNICGALIKVRNGSTLTATGCNFITNFNTSNQNDSTGYDGANDTCRGGMFFVHSGGTLTINSCNFAHNRVSSNGQGLDIFVVSGGFLNLTNSTFGKSNVSSSGNRFDTNELYESIVGSDYTSIFSGGRYDNNQAYSIYVENNGTANYTLDFTNLTFDDNDYTSGGILCVSNNLNLTNCVFRDNSGAQYGIKSNGSYKLNLDNVVFNNNNFSNRGLLTTASDLTLKDCTFYNNTGGDCAIKITGTGQATFTNCNFELNNFGSDGDLIYANSDLMVTGCKFRENNGNNLIINNGKTLTISGSDFISNAFTECAGIVMKDGGLVMSFNNQFVSNSSGGVGIAHLEGGSVASFTSNTFTGNGSTYDNDKGGIILVDAGAQCFVSSCAFDTNYVSSAESDIYGLCISNMGSLNISDTTFAGHSVTEKTVYGASIYSGSGSSLILNNISVFGTSVSGSEIYVSSADKIIEMRNISLLNTTSGIVSTNEELYIVNSSFQSDDVDKKIVTPVITHTGLGSLVIIGSKFDSLKLKDVPIIGSETTSKRINIDNGLFAHNRVENSGLLDIANNLVASVSITRSQFNDNILNNSSSVTQRTMLSIASSIVNIKDVQINGNHLEDKSYDYDILTLSNSAGQIEMLNVELSTNTCRGTVLCLSSDKDSFVTLTSISLTDNSNMQGLDISNSQEISLGNSIVNIGESLIVTGNRSAITLGDNADIKLKHDVSIGLPDILLGENSLIVLDGVLREGSFVNISNQANEKLAVATSSGHLSADQIKPFTVAYGYLLVMDYERGAIIKSTSLSPIVQDVVRTVSTTGYLSEAVSIRPQDFIANYTSSMGVVYYKVGENYTATAPQFNIVGEYNVVFKLGESDDYSFNVYIITQSLHLKTAPVVKVTYGSQLKDAVFGSYQVVNDDGNAVGGRWSFVNDTEYAIDPMEQHSVTFMPYNTTVYGEEGLTVSIVLQIYFDDLYYTGSGFASTPSGSKISGINTIADALKYMNEYATIHFSSTYEVKDNQVISASKSIYFASDVDGREMFKVTSSGVLYISGTTGKILIDGNAGSNKSSPAIVNAGKLSLGSNLIIRNFAVTDIDSSAIMNSGSLVLDGCDICNISGQRGAIRNGSDGKVVVSSGNFYNNQFTLCSFLYNYGGEVIMNGGSIYANTASNAGSGASVIYSTDGSVFLNSGVIKNNNSGNGFGCAVFLAGDSKLYLSGTHFVGNKVGRDILTADGSTATVIKMNSSSLASIGVDSEIKDMPENGGSDFVFIVMFLMLCLLCFASLVFSQKRRSFDISKRQ